MIDGRARGRPGRRALLVALLCLLFVAGRGVADEYEDRRQPGRCRCHLGEGSWEYLRSPIASPEDDPACGLLVAGGSCAHRPRPPGTSGACWASRKMECFWRRHAYSWGIRCSECWKEDACPTCDELVNGADAATRELLEERLASERRAVGGKLVVAVSPHFYVVTNLDRKMKVRTRRGSLRLVSAHEVAHLYAQRCEQAYKDFVHWFGEPVVLPKPMAVYVVNRIHDGEAISRRYFGDAEIKMNYAFNYGDRIAEGFSGNGFRMAYEEEHTDNAMHGFARHQIGHILFSCWQLTNGFEDRCPRWAWVGAAHFLEKLLEIHDEYATFCAGEVEGASGPGKRWPKRVRKLAGGNLEPIETFFHKNALGDFAYADHLRAWSIMDLALREDRTRWLALLKRLREGAEEGAAFKEALGVTPARFHEMWLERVLGRRKTLGPEQEDGTEPKDPDRRERERLESTTDPDLLAGRIRGLDVIRDRATAEAVVGRFEDASDLVRETIHLVLGRTTDRDVLTFLREEALYDAHPRVRAGVTRALGAMRHAAARPAFEILLEDRDWLVRANAAQALQGLADPAALPALLAALGDRHPKAWIGIADAFASLSGPSKEATFLLAPRLHDRLWQVRLTAAQALVRVGTEEALDALVEQFAREEGRLKREFHAALRAVARDDLGPKPESWRLWWEQQKEEYGGLPPDLPDAPRNPMDDRYGLPTGEDLPNYYGKRFFSKSVCFVLDTSDSMKLRMEIDPIAAGAFGDIPTSGTRMEIARRTLVNALERLDERTRFRIVLFHTKVRLWRDGLMPASAANIAAAARAIQSVVPEGETNFYGALKAALGLHGLETLDAKLDPIPDTVFFLTDGRPTQGEITSMPELVSWMQNLNRFAKLRLHVIALGDLNVDEPWLRKLAESVDGEFIWVRER